MKQPSGPVSMMVDVSRLPAKGIVVKLEADARQRAALAEMHALQAVEAFRFELRVSPWKREGARVSGAVKAKITQTCVLSLDPVEAAIEEDIEALFVPERSRLASDRSRAGEILLDAEGDDAPETFQGSKIDVGAVAEEFFELAIDPYPRRPDAELPDNADVEGGGLDRRQPFAKLGSLVRKR